MGQAQSPGKVYIERTDEEIAAPKPNLDLDAIAVHPHLVIGSPNPLRQFSTPEKGALTSKLYSPQGTEYHNQGAITINYNGRKINCALFFSAAKASQLNEIKFDAKPDAEILKKLKSFYELITSDTSIQPLSRTQPINLEQLKQIQIEGKKRNPSNKSVMKESAEKLFKKVFGSALLKNGRLHWLHLHAAYMIGKFNIQTQRSNSQNPYNMVMGTAAANALMTLPEMAVQRLLSDKKLNISEVNVDVSVRWKPDYPNLIADRIFYTLSYHRNSITFEINPWTLNKVPNNEEEIINHLISEVLKVSKSPEKTPPQSPLSAKTASPTTPLYSRRMNQSRLSNNNSVEICRALFNQPKPLTKIRPK